MDTKNYLVVDSVEKLEEAIARTREAQKVFATYTQEQVDKIFLAAASAANKARIPLAKMAVEETGMGIVEDKVIKNIIYSALFYFLTVAPLFICNYKLTELCSPVAEIINSDALVSAEFVKKLKRMSYNRSSEMSYVEGLGYVGRGIVKHYRFAYALVGCAVFFALRLYVGKDSLCKRSSVYTEVKISVKSSYLRKFLAAYRLGKSLGYLNGGAAKALRETEARKRKVTHSFIGGILEHKEHVVGRKKSLSEFLFYNVGNKRRSFIFKY